MDTSSVEPAEQGVAVVGQVKWFDPTKGFGFITAADGGPDILLHGNVLRSFGQATVIDGTEIEVNVVQTGRGLQATEVLYLEQGHRPVTPGLADFAQFDPEVIAAAPIEPARVKWFDKVKGFGFANVFGSRVDVFVHIEVLRQAGLVDLVAGEAIAVRSVEGQRGLMAAEVLPWETVTSRP